MDVGVDEKVSPEALEPEDTWAKVSCFSSQLCRAVCTVFSTWLSEYPEDFKSLGEPSRLLRLAPLLPQDSSSAADLRARLLRIAEELSEKALLPDGHKGLHQPLRSESARKGVFYCEGLLPFADQSGFSSSPPDVSKFEPTSILGFPAALIAEQLTKIETVSSLKGL